jgi:hypothetical protein
MRNILAFIALVLSLIGFSQEYKEVENSTVIMEFDKLSKKYQAANFQMTYNKKIYRDSIDIDPMVETKGFITKGQNFQYRMEEKGTIVIQNEHLKMTVDSASQLVTIGRPDSLFKTIDIRAFMDKKAFDTYTFKRIEYKGVIHYLIVSKNRLEGITELWINAKDFSLQKLVLSLPKANYFNESLEDETLESPLVVIIYQPLKSLDMNALSKQFSQDDWLVNENTKYSLQLSKGMFKLHDLRYNPY